ncbi:MAG: DUF2283 domain-containing protein [Chloroflexi bacterium]|nr:DUF2283 domain-containing protein [Chloroflexota bacterium]
MKITYDPEVDAAYIYFKKRRGPVTTVRLSEDIAVDFGPGEKIRGIEILDASKYLGLTSKSRKPKVELENLEIA